MMDEERKKKAKFSLIAIARLRNGAESSEHDSVATIMLQNAK